MFPLKDENPTLNPSLTTFTLIGLNIGAWVFLQGLGTEASLASSVCEYGAIPGELLGTVQSGTQVPISERYACIIEPDPKWHTLITSMFMHGGWFHIISNMWFLFIFGDNVEDSMGRFRFLIFYLLCGLAAVGAQILFSMNSPLPMVGASGAIGGVLGGYLILYPRTPVHLLVFLGFYITRIAVPAYVMLGYWFLLQVIGAVPTVGGETGGVAFWAHIGGFLAGVVLIFPFRNRERIERHRRSVGPTEW